MKRLLIALVVGAFALTALIGLKPEARTLTWESELAVDGFFVERSPASGTPLACGIFEQVAIVGDVRTWDDPYPLAPGSGLCYRVQAFQAEYVSDYSNVATWTEPAPTNSVLAVSVTSTQGPGGTVASSPAGVSCAAGSTCVAAFPVNSTVTLQATPKAKAKFTGWSGACGGSTTVCAVSMLGSQSVGATFGK